MQTVANRIIEITPEGIIDKQTTYEEYLEWRLANKTGKARTSQLRVASW